MEDTRGDTLSVTTASGNVFLSRTQVQGLASLRTASGAIRLEEADAESLEIRSVSGDVEGTLLSGKRFEVSTVTGDVDVPSSQGGRAGWRPPAAASALLWKTDPRWADKGMTGAS